MRYLHPVGANETFAAQGIYRRYIGETLTAYTEEWTLHEVTAGAHLVRLDQDARHETQEKWSRLAEVLLNPDGHVERFNVHHMVHDGSAEYQSLKLDYSFMAAYVQVTRRIDGGERSYFEIAYPAGVSAVFVRLIDFNYFWGAALQRAVQADVEQLPVFVPFIKHNMEPGQVLMGMLPPVKETVQDPLTMGNRTYASTRYETQGRQIWLDERGVPVQIAQVKMKLRDVITNYAHR